MTLTVNDNLEIPGSPEMEVVRVTSTATGDAYQSRRFYMIKGFSVQNHGATFATGTLADPPKVVLTQGTATNSATLTITHTGSAEVFSLIIWGEQ